jgi:phosphoadenosine phosphosulfate reductase
MEPLIKSISLDQIQSETKNLDIPGVLNYLTGLFPAKVVFSTSFGYEDQVITDYIFKYKIPIKIFSLDTGRLFNETYKVFNSTLQHYKENILVYFPERTEIEELLTKKGPFSFYESIENRKECCQIRKIEPLKRALKDMSCWITGLRAEQSASRNELKQFEWDENNLVFKYNPLIEWTFNEVKRHVMENHIPYNILHDRGFVSIGCEPCTRAIKPGEDFRAGRWWWEANSRKECGLHEK